MSGPTDKRRTSGSGLPSGVELHGNTLRKRITLVPGGEREYVPYLPGCVGMEHAIALWRYCEDARKFVRRGEPAPPPPWKAATGDPLQFVRFGMSFRSYGVRVALPRWDELEELELASREKRRKAVEQHVLGAFRAGEPNWTQRPIDGIEYRHVDEWVRRRKAEIVAEQRRVREGGPAPVLPGKAEWPQVRTWARRQGFLGVSDRGKPPHVVLELYREAHSTDPSAPAAPLLSQAYLDYAVWAVKELFAEAVKDAGILGVKVNPLAGLKVGKYPRAARLSRRKAPKRKPATPEQLCRIAARLHPAHRLPFWFGVIMALRVGESFGLPVRLWDPVNKVIYVEQQFRDWRETKDGPLRYLKPVPKTEDSEAHLYVPDSLAAFITAEIERVYGHALDDPWWDEPVEDPWDPLIRTRRDLPICVHPLGPEFYASVQNSFWNGLRRAAEAERIDLRSLGNVKQGPLSSHDLRRTISAYIHHLQLGSDRTRSAFLRHKHEGTWEDSEVTANHYTPKVEEGLRDLAKRLEQEFIPQLGPLAAPPPPTGADRLVTIHEVAELVGETDISRSALQGRLRRAGIRPTPNPYGYGYMGYYRVGDLELLKPADDSLSMADAAALLWPGADLSTEVIRFRMGRAVRRGALRRTRPGFYDAVTVSRLAELYALRRSGELLMRSDAIGEFGLPRRIVFQEHGIEVFTLDVDGWHGHGEYVRRSDVAAFAATQQRERVWSLAALAREFGDHTETVKRMVLAAGPEHVDPTHITDAAVAYLREHRDELLAVGWNVSEVEQPPRGTTWLTVPEAARQLGVQERTLHRRARINHWPAVRYQGVLYLQRSRINERPVPAGFFPVSDVVERLGLPSMLEEGRRLARSTWTSVEVGPHKRLFVELASVDRWLRGQLEAGLLLTADETRRRLGVGAMAYSGLVRDGRLQPKMVVTGLLGARARVPLYDPVHVDRVLKAHTPPDGWITLAEAARRSGVTHGAMRGRVERRKWRLVVDLTGTRWVDPAVAVSESVDVTGMLLIPELLEKAGMPVTRTLIERVKKLAPAWPGAVLAASPGTRGSAWWFPNDPEAIAGLPERLASRRASNSRTTQAVAAFHAKVHQRNREAAEAARASEASGEERADR